MVQNSLKLGHHNLHCPTSMGASERASEQESELVSGVSERVSGQASGPVLTAQFLAVVNLHGVGRQSSKQSKQRMRIASSV